jgi:hypothetical protein
VNADPLRKTHETRTFWWSTNLDRNSTRKIGYCRVSSAHQNLDRQLGALRAERVDVIFREKASGKSVKNRPELEKAIDELGTGDVLIVPEWDRATRLMFDGIEIIKRIHDRGALIKVLDKPHHDLTKALGRGFIAFLGAIAEDERHRMLKRANEVASWRLTAGLSPRAFGRAGSTTKPLSRCARTLAIVQLRPRIVCQPPPALCECYCHSRQAEVRG